MAARFRRQLFARLVLTGLSAGVCWAASGPAFGAQLMNSLGLSATVVATCTIDATTELALGVYDLTEVAPRDGAGSLTITCSTGSPIIITLGQGTQPAVGSTDTAPLRRMAGSGPERLQYELYRDAARSQVWGNTQPTGLGLLGSSAPQVVTIYARVPPAQSVSSGGYQDSVLATVTY